MSSPILFGGNNVSANLQGAIALSDGTVLKRDGIENYVKNSNLDTGTTTGFATYALAESVTFQDTGDTVTLNSHGLSNGQIISFTSITSTTGISTNTAYYVVGATTNTFQVATSVGGSALALTTNGSGTLVRSRPVTAFGGSANVTIAAAAYTGFGSSYCLQFVKDAANRMGQGFTYGFTIDADDKTKVLNIEASYIVSSGTFAAGSATSDSDVILYVLDVTNGTLIEPINFRLLQSSTSLTGQIKAQFQTSATGVDYRLIFHVATVSTSAYTLNFGKFKVYPQQFAGYGTIVTDWQDFPSVAAGTFITGSTSNPSYGTVSTNSARWRRVGSNLEMQWDFHQSTAGGAGSGIYLINIPASIGSIDTTKVKASTGTAFDNTYSDSFVGEFHMIDSGPNFHKGSVVVYSSSQLKVSSQYYNGQGVWGSAFGQFSNGAQTITLSASIPMLGWSSSSPVISSYDGRVVAMRASGVTASATSGNPLIFPTKTIDTHGAYNSTTGEYTVKVAGIYKIGGAMDSNAANILISLYKNGTINCTLGQTQATYGGIALSGMVECVVGDVLTIRPNGTVASETAYDHWSVELLSGAQQIMAGQRDFAEYYLSANQALTAATTRLNFDTRLTDTMGSVTTGASWAYTAQSAGDRLITLTAAGNTYSVLYLVQTGSRSVKKELHQVAGTAYYAIGVSSTIIPMNQGDTFYILCDTNVTITGGTGAGGQYMAHISIKAI